MDTRHAAIAAVAALVLIAAPAHAAEGIPRVYVADSQSCGVAAYSDTVPEFIVSQLVCSVRGMSVGARGAILIADTQQGVISVDPVTGEVAQLDQYAYCPEDVYPDCLSEDIYYVTSCYPNIYVLPGGSGPGEYCATLDGWPLAMQVHPLGERAGQVLVLIEGDETTPPRLAAFRRTGPTSLEEVKPVLEEAPSYAVGFAIRPDGGIVLLDGMTGMYDVGAEGELTHFGPAGLYGIDIDIGADGTIYVVDPECALTHRFDPDGNWILPSLNSSVDSPTAVAAVGFTPSPPGGNVPVTPVAGVELLFEEVTGGGYTSATTTATTSRVSPGGNTLPEYAGAPDGRDGFTYVSLATTAVFENLIQVDVLLPGSRLFFAHGTGEVFRDVTVEGTVEDARGVISRFSEVVVVDDTRPVSTVIDDKFARLLDVLSPDIAARRGSTERAKRILRVRALRAEQLYEGGLPEAAVGELSKLNADTRAYAGPIIPNSSTSPGGNLAGEILSRSKTLMFSLSLLTDGRGKALEASGGAGLSLVCASPARGECRMELAGPAGSHATAELYTVGGRLVRVIFDGVLSTGHETLVWDGTDGDGRPVATGVYLTRAESGGVVRSGKLVFVR